MAKGRRSKPPPQTPRTEAVFRFRFHQALGRESLRAPEPAWRVRQAPVPARLARVQGQLPQVAPGWMELRPTERGLAPERAPGAPHAGFPSTAHPCRADRRYCGFPQERHSRRSP